MRARSVVVGVLTAAALVIGGAGTASANIAWCSADPPVQVETAAGANLTVNTIVAVPKTDARYLSDVTSEAVTTPDGVGGTDITVYVHLPAGISTARVAAMVKRYKVVDRAAGQGGTTVTLHLHVPTA